ncbi:MAG: gliding motility protein GldL [Chitinophagaceae bacterium]|nr:gliding motility protein GldL [Chitinophagaceae bacterium]
MKSIALFFETSKGKYLKNFIIGFGASIVLIGALGKIQHWAIGGPLLTAGMLTEAFIFAMLGILPPHKDYYWEKIYPGLDVSPEEEHYLKGGGKKAGTPDSMSPMAAFDKMMEEAAMNPTNLNRLNQNFQKFGEVVNNIKDMSDVTAATNEYSASARSAAGALGEMSGTFSGATRTMSAFNSAADDTMNFHKQVQVLSGNLNSLNQIYEVELTDANNHLKAMNKFYSNLVSASDAMASSAQDAISAKEQMAALSKNLTSLNSIYGNMLSAMQGR